MKTCNYLIPQKDTYICYYAAVLNGFLYSDFFTRKITEQFTKFVRSLSTADLEDFNDNHVTNPNACFQMTKSGKRTGKVLKNFFAFMYSHFINKDARVLSHPITIPFAADPRISPDIITGRLREKHSSEVSSNRSLDEGGQSILPFCDYMHLLRVNYALIPIQAIQLYQQRPDVYVLPNADVLVVYQQGIGITKRYLAFILLCIGVDKNTLQRKLGIDNKEYERQSAFANSKPLPNMKLTLGEYIARIYSDYYGLTKRNVTGFELYLWKDTRVMFLLSEFFNNVGYMYVQDADEPHLNHFAKYADPRIPYSFDLVSMQNVDIPAKIGAWKVEFSCLDVMSSQHTVAGVICNGDQYILDSGNEAIYTKEWIRELTRDDDLMHHMVIYVR